MNLKLAIQSLQRFPATVSALVKDLDEETWHYKPPSGNWSIVEVVCHLRDEEVEDFRLRVKSTLEDPTKTWPKIDPEKTAIDRNYQSDNPHQALADFLHERKASLDWLHTLPKTVDWSRSYQHPEVGLVPASRLLGSWAGHDLLHLRQITKRLFECMQIASDHNLDCAGDW